MEVNVVKVVILLLFPLLIFATSFYLEKLEKEAWFIRKFIHTTGLFLVALFGSVIATGAEIIIIVVILLIIVLILSVMPSVRLIQNLIRMGTRKGEKQIVSLVNTSLTITMSLILLYLTFDRRWVFMVAILSIGLGDGFGEFIGRPYGKHKYKIFGQKSIEGSLAVFTGTFIGGLFTASLFNIFTLQLILIFILVSFVAMILEAISVQFIDNVFIPPVVAAILWFLY